MPGRASRATINANHALMVRPEATAGRLDSNPVREDLEEGAAFFGADFILDAVMGAQHRLVAAVAGHSQEAHRQGCALVARCGQLRIAVIPQGGSVLPLLA